MNNNSKEIIIMNDCYKITRDNCTLIKHNFLGK